MIVAYDGRAFHGWQKQRGLRTVQGELTRAILELDPGASEPRGASRTDAGVHARGQVVAFDAVRTLPPKGWRMQINTRLPDDVSVRTIESVAVGYDPRFDALGKHYRYRIHVGESRDPLRGPQSWHIGPQLGRAERAPGHDVVDYLDLEAMRAAAKVLEGTHDFRAFRAADDVRLNTVRTIRSLRIDCPFGGDDDAIAIDVVGNAFMKNMVRILAGTLLEVGRGKRTVASIADLLGADADRQDAGRTAPAHGLCLMSIELGRIALCEPREVP